MELLVIIIVLALIFDYINGCNMGRVFQFCGFLHCQIHYWWFRNSQYSV